MCWMRQFDKWAAEVINWKRLHNFSDLSSCTVAAWIKSGTSHTRTRTHTHRDTHTPSSRQTRTVVWKGGRGNIPAVYLVIWLGRQVMCLGLQAHPGLMHSETLFSAALKLLFIWCRGGCMWCGTHTICQTKLGIVGSYNPFYVGEATRLSKVKSAFALVCRSYANILEDQNINRQIRIVPHLQTFK